MNDAEIVRRVLAGDVNAFALLVEAHAAQVMNIAARHVPPEHAAEVAHETFVRAFEHLSAYKGKKPFVHWLTRIAVRLCADFWRGRARSRELPFSSLGEGAREWLETVPADGGGVEDCAQRSEAGVILEWAMAQLSPDDRMVLTMTHLEGQALSDVGERLGWSLSKVKVRSHRARRKLRGILGKLLE